MLTRTTFLRLQKTFYSHITQCSNKAQVELIVPSVTHNVAGDLGNFAQFTGQEAQVKTEAGAAYYGKFDCLYMRTIPDETRDKEGIDHDVKSLIYISPLQLHEKWGFYSLLVPETNYGVNLRANLFDDEQHILQIVDREPLQFDGQTISLAVELRIGDSV